MPAMGSGELQSRGQHGAVASLGLVSGVSEHPPGVSSALQVRRRSGHPVSSLL